MSHFKTAFSLSKGEVARATPLGTITRNELAEREQTNFILYPEPSRDPADPLNWPMWRKAAVLMCMALYAFVANFTSGSISSAFPLLATPLAFNPPVSMDKLSHLVAVNVLMLGVANLFWVPLSAALGRRAVVLLGLLLLTLTSVWAGVASSYGSLLAARLFMGIGGAPADTIAPKVVGEIFFLHQSGRAMGIYTAFLAVGPAVGGVSGGYIAGRLGIDWLHWMNVILSGALLLLCFLLVPETNYERETSLTGTDIETKGGGDNAVTEEVENITSDSAPFTYTKSLRFQRPVFLSLSRLLVPFRTLGLPGVWLVMLWYAGLVGGLVTMATVGPSILAAPPYLWGQNAGLINAGGIVGAALGILMTIALADRVVKVRSASTNLLLEPETRLPVAFPGLILGTCGLWVFGFCAANPSPNAWVGLEFGMGMITFAILQVPSIGFNYLIESYGPVAADVFTMITLLRSVISFSWTFFVGTWVAKSGPAVPFGVFGGLMGLFSILVIPVWIWGKRFRIATEDLVMKSVNQD